MVGLDGEIMCRSVVEPFGMTQAGEGSHWPQGGREAADAPEHAFNAAWHSEQDTFLA